MQIACAQAMSFCQNDVFLGMPGPKTELFACFWPCFAPKACKIEAFGHFDELTQIALTRQYADLG